MNLSDTPDATIAAPVHDPQRPNVARMYDYFLGGKDNFPADREEADKIIRAVPYLPRLAVANRTFLARVVRYLAREAGVRQFLDIGSGLPTRQNVHEVAQEIIPGARVVYVDNDPLVRAHATAILATTPTTYALTGDLRLSEEIVRAAGRYLDLSEPVGVLLFAVLHFFPDGGAHDPYEITGTLLRALAPGSYLAVSHLEPTPAMIAASLHYTPADVVFRDHAQVSRFFTGTRLVDPGVVRLNEWRPVDHDPVFPSDHPDIPVWVLGGVGRKP
ncbi:SAM-dependent methyltransferase [Sphaerisporangium album]|uniref:SAM-dependent methyltransferase n=1 Tax=Sphaerisporangium album TaxID=509200 RepID=A0A367FIM2_9ACTN|nr:SAM-dependent methyltransferase [Sphaerisporangium album]RCG29480.1 SAM-dependent methyltransferase [Sphaerisporangium album]